MTERITLGVDLGTSGVRVVALDLASGELVADRTAHVPLAIDGSHLTCDADVVADTAFGLIAELSEPVRAATSGVSFSVQGEAFVPLDSANKPIDQVPVSMDRRGAARAAEFAERHGAHDFQQITGQPLHGMFAVFKIANDEGSRWPSTTRYLGLGDYVTQLLGGMPVLDWTQAARFGVFDVATGTWADTIADRLNLKRLSGRLPAVAPAGSPAGTVSADASARSGLPQGTRLFVGAHDQAAAFVGGGGTSDGVGVMSLGTSECVTFASPERLSLVGTGLATYPLAPGHWLTLAGTSAGGWALQWLAEFTGHTGPEATRDFLDNPSVERTEVLLLPYFSGSGTLDNDPNARGAAFGLTLQTTPAEWVRSMYEASGYEAAKILAAVNDQVRVSKLQAVGGGAGNDRALQIRADAAGIPLVRSHAQAAARGAAMLAARGLGVEVKTPTPAAELVFQPEADADEWHRDRRCSYGHMYAALSRHP